MKEIILVGLGEFGVAWYKTLREMENIRVIVVEKEAGKLERVELDATASYHSLKQAIRDKNPDFIINATPPQVHKEINDIAFAAELPVLSEKPIAADYFSAVQMVDRAQREEIPFAIAENYRNFPIVEQVKKYIAAGEIGEIRTIDILFRKNFRTDKRYFNKLENPLLYDVAIHHLDLIRYFTDNEASSILAQNFNPKHSWFAGNCASYIFVELRNGVAVKYNGNLVVTEKTTDWLGEWTIEGTAGVIEIKNQQLKLIKEGTTKVENYEAGLYLEKSVQQFIDFLDRGQEPKTLANDYINTQSLVNFIEKSSAAGKEIKL